MQLKTQKLTNRKVLGYLYLIETTAYLFCEEILHFICQCTKSCRMVFGVVDPIYTN